MQSDDGKVLITGGAGFLGSILVRTMLAEHYHLRVLDSLALGADPVRAFLSHPNYELICGDVRDSADVDKALDGVVAVVHLAALVGDQLCARKPEEAQEVNADATMRLVDMCQARGIARFVLASTCSNYGISDVSVPADENRPLNPVSLYARTKIAAERYILDTSGDGFCPVLLRFATSYGTSSRCREDLLINSLVRDALRDGMILIYGPESWRPYTHANDIARAIVFALTAPADVVRNEVFNVVVENFTKRQIAERIGQRLGVRVEYSQTKDDPRNYRVSGEKFANAVGFKGTRSLDEALEEIVVAGELGLL